MPSTKNSNSRPQTAELMRDAAMQDAATILRRLTTSLNGLSEEEAARRLEAYGVNEVAQERRHGWPDRFWLAVRNPLVILLTFLSIVSFVTGDMRAGAVMMFMVILGVSLR